MFIKGHYRSIVNIGETMDGAKYKTILEYHKLPSFATDTMAPGWKIFQEKAPRC